MAFHAFLAVLVFAFFVWTKELPFFVEFLDTLSSQLCDPLLIQEIIYLIILYPYLMLFILFDI